MGFEGLDDGGKATLSISCSICLEDVTNYRDRGFAKLQCGHQFHLDCIGSAFNVKGVMQCPNCRKIEKGQWLFADNSSSRFYTEMHFDDLVDREDVYDMNYPESSVWCPFGEFSRIAGAVAIDEVEFPTTGYNEIIGQHVEFSDHSAAVSSAATHVCPLIAYVHPSSSSTNVGDNGDRYNNNYHNHYRWLYANAHVDRLPSPTRTEVDYLPSPTRTDVDYLPSPTRTHVDYLPLPTRTHVDHLPLPTRTSVEHLPSPTRTNVDMPTSGSYLHPFFTGQSSSTRGPSSINSVTNHPHPDSGTRAWERSQALEAYYQQQPSVRRSNTQVHVSSSSDQTRGGYYPSSSRSFHDAADNSMLHPFPHVPERDQPHLHPYPYPHETGPFHQTGSGSARQRHGSGRAPSRMQYWL